MMILQLRKIQLKTMPLNNTVIDTVDTKIQPHTESVDHSPLSPHEEHREEVKGNAHNSKQFSRPKDDSFKSRSFFSLESFTKKRNRSDTFVKWVAIITQHIAILILKPLFYSIFNIQIVGLENIKKSKQPLIIICNHISFYDGFIYHVLFNFFDKQIPIRHMAIYNFDTPLLRFGKSIGLIKLIYVLWGVFVIIQGQGAERGLRNARRIIEKGGTVNIFPEGRIVKGEYVAPFRWGAAILAQTTGANVLPIAMRICKEKNNFRKTLKINIGERFILNSKISQIDGANKMHATVDALYQHILSS